MTALAPNALTSVSDVKESLGIASSDTSWDNLIRRKINQVSDLIEKYCNRTFALTPYTNEEYNSSQIDELVLRQRPVVVDGSHTFTLQVRDTPFNENDWETIDSSLYFIDANAGVLNLNFRAAGNWNRYRATYSAGYSTIPDDLAEAAASLVSFYVTNASGSKISVQRIKEGQRETQYFDNLHGFISIMQQLGVDDTINAYANMPILTDR